MLSPNPEELAGGLVAFANAEGGVVFLGVDDSGAARGIPPERWDSVEHWLVDVATHNCDPPIRPVVRKALLPDDEAGDGRILLAEVPRGLYVHRTSGGRYYTRVGSTKRDLTPLELARLFQQRGREYVFDEQPVLAAAVNDLNCNRLEAFFGRSPTIPWLDLLRNTRVTFRDEDDMPYRTFTRNQLLVSFLSRVRSKRTGQVFLWPVSSCVCGRSSQVAGDNPQELLGIRVAALRQSSGSDAIVGQVRQSIGSAADAWTTTCAIRPSYLHPAIGVPAPGRTARRSYRTR